MQSSENPLSHIPENQDNQETPSHRLPLVDELHDILSIKMPPITLQQKLELQGYTAVSHYESVITAKKHSHRDRRAFFNHEGTKILENDFDSIIWFYKGAAVIYSYGSCYPVDTKGNQLSRYTFSHIDENNFKKFLDEKSKKGEARLIADHKWVQGHRGEVVLEGINLLDENRDVINNENFGSIHPLSEDRYLVSPFRHSDQPLPTIDNMLIDKNDPRKEDWERLVATYCSNGYGLNTFSLRDKNLNTIGEPGILYMDEHTLCKDGQRFSLDTNELIADLRVYSEVAYDDGHFRLVRLPDRDVRSRYRDPKGKARRTKPQKEAQRGIVDQRGIPLVYSRGTFFDATDIKIENIRTFPDRREVADTVAGKRHTIYFKGKKISSHRFDREYSYEDWVAGLPDPACNRKQNN